MASNRIVNGKYNSCLTGASISNSQIQLNEKTKKKIFITYFHIKAVFPFVCDVRSFIYYIYMYKYLYYYYFNESTSHKHTYFISSCISFQFCFFFFVCAMRVHIRILRSVYNDSVWKYIHKNLLRSKNIIYNSIIVVRFVPMHVLPNLNGLPKQNWNAYTETHTHMSIEHTRRQRERERDRDSHAFILKWKWAKKDLRDNVR